MEKFRAENVVKEYAGHTALNHVSISVKEASIFGLLGPNGAGKTTLIRIINQITAPDSGALYFDQKPMRAGDIAQIGYLPEERGLYRKMKVGEQALYLAQLKGMQKQDALQSLKYWFEKFDMLGWWNKRIEELSKGMAQKVQFITTVVHRPSLLIFDEPFTGFDPINAQQVKNEILELKRRGTTIIFSTHNMSSVEEICDDIVLLHRSEKILEGATAAVRERFKSNTFEVICGAKNEEWVPFCDSRFSVIEQTSLSNQQTRLVVKGHFDLLNNELVKLLAEQATIVSFKEVIPSMNDLFIQVVEAWNLNPSKNHE
ncbi:MAG: ABC transporter ATP-binding protein [Bacteroidales bacterium]